MEDDSDEFDDEVEDDINVDFKNEIAEEPLVPPAKHISRLRKLSFSFVGLLLILVGLINLAMIVWFLSRRLP
jgi:hypothetical protein